MKGKNIIMNKQKKWKDIIKKNAKWIIFTLCVAIFIYLIHLIFRVEEISFDTAVYNVISKLISEPTTAFMKAITTMGSAITFLSIIIIIFCTTNNKYGKYATINLISIVILNFIFKNIFDRPRPNEFRLIEETGYSFPSGHSMVSMAFYGLILYFIWKKVQNQYLKWSSCILLSLLIIGIGISRIYLGVHYTSDVIGGFCFSIAYLACYTHFLKVVDEED